MLYNYVENPNLIIFLFVVGLCAKLRVLDRLSRMSKAGVTMTLVGPHSMSNSSSCFILVITGQSGLSHPKREREREREYSIVAIMNGNYIEFC